MVAGLPMSIQTSSPGSPGPDTLIEDDLESMMSATHFVPNVEARKSLNENQVEEFKEAFRVFDVDNGGTIDSEEFGHLMHMLGMQLRPAELTDVFVTMDGDEDGELQFEEFLILMATLMHKEDTTDEVKEAFESIDHKGTGKIPVSIIRELLFSISENCTEKEVNALIAACDRNNEGLVTTEDVSHLLSLDEVPNF